MANFMAGLACCCVAAVLSLPASAQAPDAPTMPMTSMNAPADHSFAQGMMRMNSDMGRAAMTGDADHDFVAMMIPHHQGAIAMAQTELQYGKDPELRDMANAIIDAQDKEIAQMKAWQGVHPKPK